MNGAPGMSRGLKPSFLLTFGVQAEAWTYLRSKNNSRNHPSDTA
jgi:hypothetical protein